MLYRRSKTGPWWVRFTTPDGREIRRSSGTADKKAAEEWEARLKSDIWRVERLGERPRRSWQDAVVRWVDETAHKASHADDLSHLRWLDRSLRDAMMGDIDRDRVDAIKRARKAGGASNATVNRTLALLRAILRRAEREWGWINRAPAVRLLPEPQRRVRWLTREEAERLLAELPEHLAEMARFSLATGLREANVTGLRWDQIDLAARQAWIHPDESKTGRGLSVPLNRDAVLVLRRQEGRHPERVFTYRGQPVTKAGVRAWRNALHRAAIEDFRWHDLRHTWASWHVQSGTPLHVLQELGGWATAAMVRRYAHLSAEHLAGYAGRIEAPLRTIPGTADQDQDRKTA